MKCRTSCAALGSLVMSSLRTMLVPVKLGSNTPRVGAGEGGRRIGRGLKDLVQIELGDDRAADPLQRRAAAPLPLGLSAG